MLTFIIVLVIIVVVIFAFQRTFFTSSTTTKSENFSSSNNYTESSNSTKPKLYIFVSTTCPACIAYKNNVHTQVLSDAQALGIDVQLVYLDKPEDMANQEFSTVEKECGVEFIPTACMVSNGKTVKLGNGNGLNRDKLAKSL